MSLLAASLFSSVPAQAFEVSVSVSTFEPALSPYGEWVYVEGLGRVWRPFDTVVGADFEPYQSGGQWVYTDQGWMFESEWDWGWAPFHYGRWWRDVRFGWVWYPDTVWAPAWVEWRYGGGYVGWTPLAPSGFSVTYSSYRPSWCFVPEQHLVSHDFRRHRLPQERARVVFSDTRDIHPASSVGRGRPFGPPVGHIASASRREIRPVSVAAPPPGVVKAIRTRAFEQRGPPPGSFGQRSGAGTGDQRGPPPGSFGQRSGAGTGDQRGPPPGSFGQRSGAGTSDQRGPPPGSFGQRSGAGTGDQRGPPPGSFGQRSGAGSGDQRGPPPGSFEQRAPPSAPRSFEQRGPPQGSFEQRAPPSAPRSFEQRGPPQGSFEQRAPPSAPRSFEQRAPPSAPRTEQRGPPQGSFDRPSSPHSSGPSFGGGRPGGSASAGGPPPGRPSSGGGQRHP